MQDIVVLRDTPKGVVIDTVYSQQDTLFVDFKTTTSVELPDEPFVVRNIPPGKDNLDLFSAYAIIIGGLAGLFGAIAAFWQLFKKDKDKQNQLDELKSQTDELIKQNGLFERRIRMSVKPQIYRSAQGTTPARRQFQVYIKNRGENAFVDHIELLEGNDVRLEKWGDDVVISKGDQKIITGHYGDIDRDTMKFSFRIHYHDSEGYCYETDFEWSNRIAKIIETREL